MANLTGTGKETGNIGSSQGQMVYEIPTSISLFGEKTSVYKKVHKFMTFGFANVILQPAAAESPIFMTTFLAEIPWHIPALYLNPSEFNLLPPSSRVLAVKLSAVYRGSTIQFETASTATGLATLNQINDIGVAVGLNRSGQGSNAVYASFNSTQPMIPATLAKPYYDTVTGKYRGMVRDYYGQDNTVLGFKDDIPKHQVGRQTFLYNYWVLSNLGYSTGAGLNAKILQGGWPCLQEKITQYDGKTVINQTVVSCEYEPKQGIIKEALRSFGHGLPAPVNGSNVQVPVNGQLAAQRYVTITAPSAQQVSSGAQQTLSSTDSNVSNVIANDPEFTIYTPIEKSQYIKSGFWGTDDNPHIQPSVHIGVQPVPALSTAALLGNDTQFNSWTDTRAYWEVTAEMIVKEHTPTAYPYATAANIPWGENVMYGVAAMRPAVNINPRDDGATMCGLYTKQTASLPADVTPPARSRA